MTYLSYFQMSIFESIKKRLEKISEFMDLKEEEVNLLLKHKQTSHKVLTVNGKEYDAWRIIHNNALGPGKGGIRFHQDVSEDEVKSLSFWMSLKTSLIGIPLGGAKGGVKVNPKELNDNEIELLSRAYVKAFSDVIGADKDIPAPDIYTNSQIMGWMLDEYEKIKGLHEPAMITGKPLELGGLALRSDSTSRGGFIVLTEFLKKTGKKPEDLKIAIQGFGNAGSNLASYFKDKGCTIVSVSDSKGGILTENCINIDELIKFKREGNTVSDFTGKKITNSEILELDVDVLILAALENQITEKNADKIKAKYILELANGPISVEADEILFEKGIIVIPDILANAGGVLVSYFEWAQNKIGNLLEEDSLKDKLEEMMLDSFHKVYDLYNKNKDKIDMRTASYVIAIQRILDAEKARGNL